MAAESSPRRTRVRPREGGAEGRAGPRARRRPTLLGNARRRGFAREVFDIAPENRKKKTLREQKAAIALAKP